MTDDRIRASIDGEPVIDAHIVNRLVGLRSGEIESSKPLGLASYPTTAHFRKLEYRVIPP